jgi:hypothetical protein
MQSFEALNPRAVAVVIDPIQSVKGKVVIDAFRLINPQTMMLGQEPRQTTSNVGHLNKPSIQVRYQVAWGFIKLCLFRIIIICPCVLSGPYSWAEQTLLLYCNQLPEK